MLHNLPMGELDNFEMYRRKTFNYLYFCDKCIRSFDSITEQKTCKLCASSAREVSRKKKENSMKKIKEIIKYIPIKIPKMRTQNIKLSFIRSKEEMPSC